MKSVNNLDHFTHSFLISRKAESFFFFLYFCMTPDRFELLLELLVPKLRKRMQDYVEQLDQEKELQLHCGS